MKLKNIALFALLAAATTSFVSCDDFLDKDPSKSSKKTLKTADQLDAILGTYTNFYSENDNMGLASDDYAATPEIHKGKNGGMSTSDLQIILWNDTYDGSRTLWGDQGRKIYYANLTLANINNVSGDATLKANLTAEAHLIRAYSMFQLAVGYTLYYDGTNGGELGLPLKKTISFEESVARASLADTWSFIDGDVQEALKTTAPFVKDGKRQVWRGTTVSAHAFAARYYLYRNDYPNALIHAEAVLSQYKVLKDFNTQMSYHSKTDQYTYSDVKDGPTTTVTIQYPYTFSQFSGVAGFTELLEYEDLLYARTSTHAGYWHCPSQELLDTYAVDAPGGDVSNDLRYKYFMIQDFSLRSCNKNPAFHWPGYVQFYYDSIISGMTVAEMILIKAEVQARQGNWQDAMTTLDPLRKSRIATAAYTKLDATSKDDAIKKILQERRREMPFSIRWYDQKRLNNNDYAADDVIAIRKFYPYTTTGVQDNDPVKEYKLEPKSRRYALQIPKTELDVSRGEIKPNTY